MLRSSSQLSRASVTCFLGVEQGGEVHLDKLVCARQGSWSKVVAVPVVVAIGAHGSRRAENVWRCRRCSSALLSTSL